ncbi:FMR1 neighbor protein [Podarcis raffonei]|uniref:FMR1 neighbor protein n=1 Tax=Podarcis raffonei TaxID=65483 RepID=UPI002329347A|nr:FMR1 neighbor protein [Podarcis raffonei]XP_053229348.1 FMR1 neighbor protein [Podarcis raffonei]XP_053229349.1 FMR1 neighbor protein [Podarcis raffonei]
MMISVTQILAKCLYVLYHAVGPSSAFPTLDDLNETEVAPPEPRTKVQIVSEQLVTFFNPVTCRPKTNQAVVPCQAGEKSNKSLCLEHKCCFSSKKHVQLDCYTPLKDRPQQILRMLGAGIGGLTLLACLPCCCFILERSPCFNALRRGPKGDDFEEDSDDESDESSDSDSSSSVQDDVEKQTSKKEKGK